MKLRYMTAVFFVFSLTSIAIAQTSGVADQSEGSNQDNQASKAYRRVIPIESKVIQGSDQRNDRGDPDIAAAVVLDPLDEVVFRCVDGNGAPTYVPCGDSPDVIPENYLLLCGGNIQKAKSMT